METKCACVVYKGLTRTRIDAISASSRLHTTLPVSGAW